MLTETVAMDSADSAIKVLTECLVLPNADITSFIMTCLYDYVRNFLRHNPNVLDPHLPHIKLRIALTAEHPSVGWSWTQDASETKQEWVQEEHATVFVLSILRYLVSNGYCAQSCDPERAIYEIHQWLCILQSLWLENGVWVDDLQLQTRLKNALVETMRKIEEAWAS